MSHYWQNAALMMVYSVPLNLHPLALTGFVYKFSLLVSSHSLCQGAENCYYQGKVREKPEWEAVVNLCCGLQ